MKYTLNKSGGPAQKGNLRSAIKSLIPLMVGEKRAVILALLAIVVTSASNLISPVLIGHTVDTYIATKQYHGIAVFSGILFVLYLAGTYTSYFQIKTMGAVGRRILFNLRNALFTKLQSLPVAFFNQNKAGDLISRINNDTDKLNQFFAQALMQFLGNLFLIIGAGIFLIVLNPKLGLASLVPAAVVVITTRFISPWVKRSNLKSLQSLGGLSAEIQESLENFKVIVAFNRLDYFRTKFNEVNEANYGASIKAGVANNVFVPLYGLAFNIAQVVVLAYGITLIAHGGLTVGVLIGFVLYVNSFYTPLRQLASVWSSLQQALAGLDRISEVLALESDMPVINIAPKESGNPTVILSETKNLSAQSNANDLDPSRQRRAGAPLVDALTSNLILEFKNVSFSYPDGKEVLHNINLGFKPGHTYAMVGPTGGGKTTTASLMARLYDTTSGMVLLGGKDIRSYEPSERAKKIGFILQEPFLFTGTVGDNIAYGNEMYAGYSPEKLATVLKEAGLESLLARFDGGLETPIKSGSDSISLGQKQLIAFMRAVLRKPEILILDEASANIDTVTEQMLEDILKKLPAATTKVIIAHRLNTIANADEIYFVNAGTVTLAGSMEHAVEMLLHGKRGS